MQIFTDGACSGNPGMGAWAFTFKTLDPQIHEQYTAYYGKNADTTNNRMEMMAIISAMDFLKKNNINYAMIFTDSKYALDGLTKWLVNWKKNNWITSARQHVKNQDLWQMMDTLYSFLPNIQIQWVKGHSTNFGNNIADIVAQCSVNNHTECKCYDIRLIEWK